MTACTAARWPLQHEGYGTWATMSGTSVDTGRSCVTRNFPHARLRSSERGRPGGKAWGRGDCRMWEAKGGGWERKVRVWLAGDGVVRYFSNHTHQGTDRQTERHWQTQTDTDSCRHRWTDRQRQSDTGLHCHTDTEASRHSKTDAHGQTHSQLESGTKRVR